MKRNSKEKTLEHNTFNSNYLCSNRKTSNFSDDDDDDDDLEYGAPTSDMEVTFNLLFDIRWTQI